MKRRSQQARLTWVLFVIIARSFGCDFRRCQSGCVVIIVVNCSISVVNYYNNSHDWPLRLLPDIVVCTISFPRVFVSAEIVLVDKIIKAVVVSVIV